MQTAEEHPDGPTCSPEIKELILNGTLCEQCGEYIGSAVGYPRECGCCKD